MERRFFIKNIFGAVVGVALLPTAIMETSSAAVADTKAATSFFGNVNAYKVGDIIQVPNGKQFLIINIYFNKDSSVATGRALCRDDLDVMIYNSEKSNVRNARLMNSQFAN